MISRLLRLARRFRAESSGVAAVEFAIIAPVLVLLVLGGSQVWDAGTRVNNMRASLRPAAQYYMNGGADDAQAQAIALAAWQNPPGDANISTARSCRCGQVAQDCATLCAGGIPPSVFVTVTATGSWTGVNYVPSATQSTVIRVR